MTAPGLEPIQSPTSGIVFLGAALILGLAACGTGRITGSPDWDGGVADAGGDREFTTCAAPCHGSEGNPAPPFDTQGRASTSERGVGAHRSHSGPSLSHREVPCSACHVVPTRVDDPGHLGSEAPAELTFSGVAASTEWDGEVCSSSYCHGASLTGGTITAPRWTLVDGSQAACGACHGVPPPPPHPDSSECGDCHPTMIPGAGLVIAYPELHGDGKLDVVAAGACDGCHGSDGNPAPPVDLAGNTSTTETGVGAHRAHLQTSTWHKQVSCAACHVVPTAIADVGHADTDPPAELTFGPLAGAAVWDGSTCSGSYCHGSSLTGGTATEPVWTTVDGSQATCDSCHGAPPPPPHPDNSDCGLCHPTMTPGAGLVIAYPALHIDGNLDLRDDQPCDTCHGSDGVAAPPRDVSGNTSTSAVGVGAHRSHLGPSDRHKKVPCQACHQVPTNTTSIGHIDSPLPAELVFGGLAGDATWNGDSCENSYCHGATLTGGNATTPVWTTVDGSQATCDSCHGAPPPEPHSQNPNCGLCHQTMETGTDLVIADPDRHIDGNVDVIEDQPCDGCHGSDGEAAPPRDLSGNTATVARGVGAHRNHLAPSDWHKQVDCDQCHVVPTVVTAVGHADTPLPAELQFGALAGSAVWNGATCTNSYCHGASLTGGAATSPRWTLVDGSQTECDSCHGAPPPFPHPANSDCGLCHPTMTPGGGLVITYPELHIDGNLDVNEDEPCDGCHGSAGVAAPPIDLAGNTATSARGVGAHRNHSRPSDWRAPFGCDQCHRVPTTVNSVGHRDSDLPAELDFGPLAGAAVWNGTACSGAYCHGATLTGGDATAPVWTTVDGSQAQCDSCHGAPPPLPHPANPDCGVCHQSMNPGEGLVIADPARHIDGTVDVIEDAPCDSCHGGGGNPAPPVDVDGATSTSARGVGAHRAHLGASSWHLEVACDECHVVPTSLHAVGHVDTPTPAELRFGPLAGATSWNGAACSNSYCHGATLTGGTHPSPVWTVVDGSQSTCHSCHGYPPPLPHPANSDCGVCHQSMTPGSSSITNPSLHIDGNLDVIDDAPCDSCHGQAGNAAPPLDLAGNSSPSVRGVGAHREHLDASTWHAPVRCDDCHQVPATVSAVGHIDTGLPAELRFSARSGSVTWNGVTCSNSYCHGADLAGGAATAPIWTTTDGSQTQCDSCHGNPPPPPHPDSTACESCHGQVIAAGGVFVAPELHIDGLLQVDNAHDANWDQADQHGYAFDQGGPTACAGSSCHGATLTGGPGGSCDECHSGWKTSCTFCHGGTLNETGAPPASIYGATARSNVYVGAHTEHVETTSMHQAWGCGECHTKPSSAMSPGHVDGDNQAEVVFSSLNPVATYNPASGLCGSLYCHGNGRTDGGSATWSEDPTLTCASCHSANGSGMSGRHSTHANHGIACYRCHQTVVNASMDIVGLGLHVDGAVAVSFSGGGTWNSSSRSCSSLGSGCHGSHNW